MNPSLRANRAVLVVLLSAAVVGGCGGDEAGEPARSSQVTSSSHAEMVATTIASDPTSIGSSPSLLDLVVSDPNFGGLQSSLGEELARLPELVAVSPFRVAGAVVGDEEVQFVAVDPTTVGVLFDLGVVEGSVAGLAGGGVMLHESRARDLGVGVGDSVAVAWQRGGSHQLEVVGVFTDNSVGSWLISLDVWTESSGEPPIDMFVAARLEDGVSEDVGRAAVAAVVGRYPNAEARWRSDIELPVVVVATLWSCRTGPRCLACRVTGVGCGMASSAA